MGLGIQRFVFGVLILAVIGVGAVQLWARTARTPDTLGVVDGQLRDCPAGLSNCVVSTSEDPDVAVPVIECPGFTGAELLDKVTGILAEQPGTSIVTREDKYVHAVSQTPFFGFKDDVELLMRANLRFVDVRSQSRLGSDDLGTNRERIEDFVRDVNTACIG